VQEGWHYYDEIFGYNNENKDFYKAQILTRMFDDPCGEHFPRPFEFFYEERAFCEDIMQMQSKKQLQGKVLVI